VFDFLKPSSSKKDASPAAASKAKPNALRGLPLAEQDRALEPGQDQRGPESMAKEAAPKPSVASKGSNEKRQEKVLGAAHEIGNQDVVLEQLAHRGANKAISGELLSQWGYREAGAVADPESGFRAVLFMPTAEVLEGKTDRAKIARAIHGGTPPPVLAFRGTQEKRGAQDDVNREGIGTYQFESNVGRVHEMFGAAGGKAIVAGHSLGGALAQLAAARFPSAVQRIVTFQAPAVSAKAADAVAKHNAESPNDQIKSSHYRASGDLVHTAGEKLTKGDVFTFESKGIGHPGDHLQFPLARLAAARGSMIPGVTDKGDKPAKDALLNVKKTDSDKEKSGIMPALAEKGRKMLGGVIRDESMERYVQLWRDVEAMCKSRMFTESYVMGVIESMKDLKAVQKDKMRLQVKALYAELPKNPAKEPAEPPKDPAKKGG
jgi:fermentation-respiration switch protein FrsA (DUF1100 family)